MEKIKLVQVGIGGYGDVYMRLLMDYIDKNEFEFSAVVDPFAKSSKRYEWIAEHGIPIYDTLEEMYEKQTADLVIVCTPIKFHKQQALTALRHGSHVLCEKPLVPILPDADELEQAAAESGRLLGVGFQWSYNDCILKLKEDITSGVLGRPLRMKTFICWQRFDYYYAKGWTGKIKDQDGNWILDSIATNATAHYLHNIFYVLGGAYGVSKMPVSATALLYRAKPIESFDTCLLRGAFDDGCEFYYLATHSGERTKAPKFQFEFENAVVEYNMRDEDSHIRAYFHDGKVKDYGSTEEFSAIGDKIRTMLRAIRGEVKLPCTKQTVTPHLKVCNMLFDRVTIQNFPVERIYRDTEEPGSFVHGLYDLLLDCYGQFKLPSELGCDWMPGETELDFTTYKGFDGSRFA